MKHLFGNSGGDSSVKTVGEGNRNRQLLNGMNPLHGQAQNQTPGQYNQFGAQQGVFPQQGTFGQQGGFGQQVGLGFQGGYTQNQGVFGQQPGGFGGPQQQGGFIQQQGPFNGPQNNLGQPNALTSQGVSNQGLLPTDGNGPFNRPPPPGRRMQPMNKIEAPINKRGRRMALCPTCNHWFADKGSVKKHIRSVHEGLKPHACEVCGQKFAEKSNLRKHFKARHTDIRDFKCPKCSQKFTFNDGLMRHYRLVHQNIRNYPCQICGSAFKQKTHLDKHMKTHQRQVQPQLGSAPSAMSNRMRPPQLVQSPAQAQSRPQQQRLSPQQQQQRQQQQQQTTPPTQPPRGAVPGQTMPNAPKQEPQQQSLHRQQQQQQQQTVTPGQPPMQMQQMQGMQPQYFPPNFSGYQHNQFANGPPQVAQGQFSYGSSFQKQGKKV